MNFKIEKNNFIKTLQKVQGIVEKKNTMPVLANVLIEAKDNSINILATDLEIFIKDSVEAEVTEEGTVTVNAKKLYEIVKELPEKEIDIKLGAGEKLTIKSGKSRFNILGLPAKEFPSFPEIEEDKLKKVDSEVLGKMIEKTSFAVSTDETRYNINGFYIEKDKDVIRMVTTDGHRLAVIESKTADVPAGDRGVILPRKGVSEIKKLLDEKEGDFLLAITEKSATAKNGNTVINIRLIDGEFPDYKQVVPKDNDKRIKTNKEDFLSALKRVSLLSSDRIKGVKFLIKEGRAYFSSSSPDIGDADEDIAVEYNGEEIEVAFNAKYFIDALEATDGTEVTLLLKDSLSPGILEPTENKDYKYIIMPMRL